MLWKRLLSALVGIPVIILAVWYGGYYLLGLTSLIFFLGLTELIKISSRRGLVLRPLPAFISGGIFLYSACVYDNTYFSGSLTVVLIIFLLNMFFSREGDSLVSVAVTFFSVVYMALITYIYLLRNLSGGLIWLVFLLVCIWANDTAAYFGGKKFGRSPLAKGISPGKTREGAVFGVLGSLFTAYVFTVVVPYSSLPVFSMLILGVLVAVAGQVGDLVESAIKREMGVKDSGNLIPGHGGVLDRFDSLLLGAPLVYYYVSLLIIS